MKSFRIKLVVLLLLAAGLASWFWFGQSREKQTAQEIGQAVRRVEEKVQDAQKEAQNVETQKEAAKENTNAQGDKLPQAALLKVPFTSQAPTGNWQDEVFQDGCEEASSMMAMAWVHGAKLGTPPEVENEIRKITAFEKNMLGDVIDTSVDDVAKMMRAYYKYDKITVQKNISAEDIKKALAQGRLVLVPVFGQALGNPNYTAPGPVTHMLVVVGYDDKTSEFITNDSGTKRGEGYRYAQQKLFEAIWMYPTGKDHAAAPAVNVRTKAMLVVEK